jgi:hypothetical protein
VELGWPDAATAGEVGSPKMAVVRRLFVAPHGASVTIHADPGAAVTLDSDLVGMPLVLVSVQPPIPKIPGALENAVFQFDQAAYRVDDTLPAERATVEELGVVCGQRLFLLTVHPIAYNPVRRIVTFWPKTTVDIRFEGASAPSGAWHAGSGLRGRVLNPESLPAGSRGGRGSGNYLIVTASAYASAIGTFADAKSAQGFNVTTWTAPGPDQTAIKNHIEDLYGGADSPDYVLLVGDTDTIPNWTGGGAGTPATDLPYVCMDGAGDWYPDIPIGRFSVRNTGQLQAIVDKTLYYENGPLDDPDYVMRAVFMASEDNYAVSEGTHNWVIENYMEPSEIVSDKLYCHTYGATTQDTRDSFNDGRFFGIYSGHGGTYSWADGPVFSQSDVNGLTNENMYACVWSFACITGTYTVQECFTETWIRAPDKGAATIIGSSVNSYWTEDDVLEKRLFDAIYDEEDDVLSEVGPVWNDTLLRYLAQMGSGSTTRRYFEMYNLMGDPSLEFPGASQGPLTISFPDGLPELLPPNEPTEFIVRVFQGDEEYVSGTGTLHCRFDLGAFQTEPLVPLGEDLYLATLPGTDCGAAPQFYLSAEGTESGVIYAPPAAPGETFIAGVGEMALLVDDNFETDQGWTVENIDLEDGAWERGIPVGGGARQDPATDFDGSGQCYLTGNETGNSDVDGGPTRLISPVFDLSQASDPMLSYARWWHNDDHDGDPFDVEISNDDGVSWVLIEHVVDPEDDPAGDWVDRSVRISDFVTPTSQVKVRFSAMDSPNNSVSEGGVDAFSIVDFYCTQVACDVTGDLNGDAVVNGDDIDLFVTCFLGGDPLASGCACADMDGSQTYESDDILLFVSRLLGT